MKNLRKILSIAIALVIVISIFVGCSKNPSEDPTATTSPTAEPTAAPTEEPKAEPFKLAIRSISKYGNVVFETTFDYMKEQNIEVGDIITVTVGENSYDLPVGTEFANVDSGEMICRFDPDDLEVAVAINMGNFAETVGIGTKEKIEEEPGYKWTLNVNEVTMVLKEKGGFMNEYKIRNLVRDNEKSAYPDLTDEQYANFREISVGNIKSGVLYRSTTPIEPAIGRNEIAMIATENAGIKTIINLDDTEELMKSYETFEGSYYASCNIVNPEMNYDFLAAEFGEKVKESILFMVENDGPYLIHCKEGKDRTGMLCAIIECYMGASYDEIVKDYMETYKNFYRITETDEIYEIIVTTVFEKNLNGIFGVEDIKTANLKEVAEKFLLGTGLTSSDLSALAGKLA